MQALHSRWRWLHAAFFYLGPPVHILVRVWPVLALNMLLMSLVAADHVVRVMQTEAIVATGAPVPPRHRVGFLPDLSQGLSASLDPLYRYLLFAISLLLALRLNRTYERCAAPLRVGAGCQPRGFVRSQEAAAPPARHAAWQREQQQLVPMR